MIKDICTLLQNKKILLLGFGKEGRSTYQFLRKHFPDQVIGIYDKNGIKDTLVKVEVHEGDTYEDILKDYEIIIKSPGIVLNPEDGEVLSKITSQTDIFLQFYKAQTIGITGTKGKSTTASLLYHILQSAGLDSLLVGNIGVPVFDVLEQIKEGTLVVYELSSHQLQYVKNAPHIGVLLNIYQEHLDHYGTFNKYVAAKENIFLYQKEEDIFLYNKEFTNPDKRSKAKGMTISYNAGDSDIIVESNHILYQGNKLEMKEDEILLKGHHNLYNIAAAYALAKVCGVSDAAFMEAIKTFRPLPHRLEYVAEINGVTFYNDSISTICETTMNGVISVKNVDTVILGGMDRGIDYEPLVDFLVASEIHNIILMPDTGYRIQKLLINHEKKPVNKNIIMVTNVEEAVKAAKKETRNGKTCLFSPAAASYGFFKNFEERGEVFKRYVLNQI